MAKAKRSKTRGKTSKRRAPARRKAVRRPARRAKRASGAGKATSQRIAALEAENRRLRAELEALRAGGNEPAAEPGGETQPTLDF
ncbi:MAG TPA: hypothetical protein VKA21_13870 [Candidatus Binatia bacterium]|nr:hypothetical protein [Candidatus Binatia bacterium]